MERLRRFFRALLASRHPVRFLVSRLLFHARLSSPFVMERHGVRYRFWPSSMSLTLFADPAYGSWDREVVRALVRKGDTVVDVGANIGFVALEAARACGSSGKVVAYEPHPRVLGYLRGNAALNPFPPPDARGSAVGSAPGTIRLSDDGADDQNRVVGDGGFEVPVVRLDDDAPAGPVRLLKIDVEGFEVDVLRGAKDVLARSSWVYVEVASEQQARYGRGAADVLALLEGSGFECWTRDGGEFRRVAREAPPAGCVNVLAFRRECGDRPPRGSLAPLASLIRDAAGAERDGESPPCAP